MKTIAGKLFILAGAIGAIAGFLLIDNYRPLVGVVGNAMVGKLLGGIPYRYVLLCSVFSIGFGLYRLWMGKNTDDKVM